jgi:phytoene synthase
MLDARDISERVRQSGSSFYWAMRLMGEARRQAMYAIYAFCREIDDIADGEDSPAERLRRLEQWREQVEAVYGGNPSDPLAAALVAPVAAFDLQKPDFLAVIDGCAMDAREEMVRPSAAVLDLYCDRVACAVGRLSVRVFGCASARAMEVADHLGRALQLTNILRDVGEDAARGRLYLPDELLSAHGIRSADPRTVLADPSLAYVCQDLAGTARAHFAAAAAALAGCPRRPMRPAVLMMALYRGLLDRLEAGEWRRFDQRLRLPLAVKLWYALRHGVL